MKFSIIIPAHNEENNIRKALESVVQQSYKDYELIVVCDACTDRTKEIADNYADVVLEVDAHNAGASRNAGLEVAKGEWILFCDADDWYLHEFVLQQLADKVGKENEDVVIFTLIWRNMGYGTIRSPRGTIYPHVANKCWRKSSIANTRFPTTRGDFAEDDVFFRRMMDKRLKIVEWDMPLYYYNWLNPGSMSCKLNRSPEKTIQYWRNH